MKEGSGGCRYRLLQSQQASNSPLLGPMLLLLPPPLPQQQQQQQRPILRKRSATTTFLKRYGESLLHVAFFPCWKRLRAYQ